MKRSDRKGNGDGNRIEIPVVDEKEEQPRDEAERVGDTGSVTLPAEEFEALKAEAEELKDRYLRAVADFDNFRKRVEKEKEDIICYANERLISDLLPILDNLERALSPEHGNADIDSILEGVRMVSQQLHGVLRTCGLEPVEAVGSPFDPLHHEAVGVLPSGDRDAGTVLSELQRGYRLKGKVLRPSKVHVAGKGNGEGEGEDR